MNRRQFLAASGAALGVLVGCSSRTNRSLPTAPTGTWRHRGHDAHNTNRGAAAVPARGSVAWTAGDVGDATPLVADGVVYTAASTVSALDAQTGETVWEHALPSDVSATPALSQSTLLVPTADHLVALDAADGSHQWATPLAQPAGTAVTASAGRVVVPLPDRGLVAYDTDGGERRWRDVTLGSRQPAIADGVVYTTGYRDDGNTACLRALNAADGSRRWTTDIDHPDTPPVLTDAGVLVGAGGALVEFDRSTGRRRRVLEPVGEAVREPLAVGDGTAFVTSYDGAVVAVSLADGTRRWRVDADVMAGTGISIGRAAAVASVTSHPDTDAPGVVALDASNGSLRWAHPIEGFDAAVSAAPVLADGAVFYPSSDQVGVVALGDLPATTDN